MKKPTAEQDEILDAIADSTDPLMINALAGTGKTSTLKMVETVAVDDCDVSPILYLVFNAANAKAAAYKPGVSDEEMAKRMGPTTTVLTLNSLGHRIWMKACASNVTVDRDKTKTLLTELIKEMPKGKYRNEASDAYWEVIQGVALAKAIGYVPERYYPNAKRLATDKQLYARLDEEPSEATCQLIDEMLVASIKASYKGFIDFNDQIYMPALFGGSYPRFPLVMVDEFQDLNPCNHEMCSRLFAKGRGVGVGDPWQSIYAFRGAQQGGMEEAKKRFQMKELNLSVSFRCPRAVVEAARWRVPHFKWFRDGGDVRVLDGLDWDTVPDDAVFICRNNAPLFRLAMLSLCNGRSVNIGGSDIGPKLIATMRKLGDESLTRSQLIGVIEEWRAHRLAKGSKSADDMAACMTVFAEQGSDLGQAIAYAEHLFAQRGAIRMMTGHKSKGLEFDTPDDPGPVYFLDPHLCREDEQDLNLRYVIQTRSANRLHYIESARITFYADQRIESSFS